MVKNVLLIKRPCFLSNINDSMKGFTPNRRYSEYTRVGGGRRVGINNFSPLFFHPSFNTQVHNTASRIYHTHRSAACVQLRVFAPLRLYFFTFPFHFL